MSRQRFPCHNLDSHDKKSGVAIGFALGEVFMSRQSLIKTKSFYVVIKYFYVTTELTKVKRIYVATKCFYVMTEFGQDQEFLCHDKIFFYHDRVWLRQRILGHDIVFSYRDRVWGKGQESLCHDREFDITTKLLEIVSR